MSVADRHARELWTCQLGSISYGRALSLQERLRQRRIEGELPDILLALEHPAVYTRGRRSRDSELVQDEDFYRARGIEVLPTDRGGRVTYHGPGQLVGYPIMRVADIHSHLRAMEAAIIAALAEVGIGARSRATEGPDFTGVWVSERKIASIGVHVAHGVSTHGLAVNVCNDLEPFSWVTPCGLSGVQMTSIAQELGSGAPSITSFRTLLAGQFCRVHGRRERAVSPTVLLGSALPRQANRSLVAV
jgi:lipoyl(octanoyl) transferase